MTLRIHYGHTRGMNVLHEVLKVKSGCKLEMLDVSHLV